VSQINASTVDVQANPKVAVFPDGGYVVAWEASPRSQAPPGTYLTVLHARLFAADGTPTTGELVLTPPHGGNSHLDGVAADGNGSFVAAWDEFDTVFVKLFNRAGKSITAPVQAPDTSPRNRYYGALAVGVDGRIAVMWAADEGNETLHTYRNDADARIFSSRLVPLTVEMHVSLGSATDGTGPYPDSLAMAADGSLIAALTYAGDGVDVFVTRIAANGAPLHTDDINTEALCCGSNTYDSSLALAADGSFGLVWDYSLPGDLSGLPLPALPEEAISGRFFTADGKTVEPHVENVNFRPRGMLTAPVMAALAGGGYFAAWEDQSGRDGDGAGIYGRLLGSDGTPLGRDILIDAITAGNQYSPTIAAGAGGAVVVWVSGPGTTLYARRVLLTPGALLAP
jgi:sugar lactone lactonase YvrE